MGEKTQLYGRFKRQTSEILGDLNMVKKVNLKREPVSLLIVAQNNTICTDYVKARIDKTQQNNKCILCGDRDETINQIISEYS